mgnify:CR=1 FL=1
MKTARFPVRAEVVRAMSLPLCAVALVLCAASAVRAAPRSEMVTPGYKPCALRPAATQAGQAKAPAVAFPDRGHLPPSSRVAVAAPQCATKVLS